MAVKLRLMRFGKRNRPCYRVCAVDTRSPRDGAYIESIGAYNPFVEDDRKKIQIDKERAEYWLSVGAQPSETVASFLRRLNVSGLVRARKPARRRVRKKVAPKTKEAQARLERKQAKRSARKQALARALEAKKQKASGEGAES